MNFKKLAAMAALTMASYAPITSSSHALEIFAPKAVVELFTSQGCSSCPPADKILAELNTSKEILGLAQHVDYWDYIGWKDTFASPENTARQRRYASALGERSVYTPQAIINGRTHVVGSMKHQILEKAKDFNNSKKALTIPVSVTKDGEIIKVSVEGNVNAKNASLYAFYFTPKASVEIKRGENTGREIEYSNVVGKVEMIGMAGENGFMSEFSIDDMRQKGYAGCALILQGKDADGFPGPILGATVITDL